MAKAKKAKDVTKAQPEASLPVKTDIPEELTEVWDQGIADSFAKLKPKQQNFLLEYVQCWNGAEAYRRVYNPLANNDISRTLASRLIANDNITAILGKFTNNKTEALILVQKTYMEAAREASKPIFGKDEDGQPVLVMEQPDYAVRVKAGEAMAKLYGFNQQGETPAVNNNIIVQVNLPSRGPVG